MKICSYSPLNSCPVFGGQISLVAAKRIASTYDLSNKRILEVGCGLGEVASHLQELTGSEIVAVDIQERPEWNSWGNDSVSFIKTDLTSDSSIDIGTFDFVYSMAVLEHVRHPYSMLEAIYSRLKENGSAYIYFNLYRGTQASHRYREVFFPWPHLLFDDSVFEEFYGNLGCGRGRPSWVNRLSIADYLLQLDRIGFKIEKKWFGESNFDQEFYLRFEDKLGRYPQYDLNKEFIHLVLSR